MSGKRTHITYLHLDHPSVVRGQDRAALALSVVSPAWRSWIVGVMSRSSLSTKHPSTCSLATFPAEHEVRCREPRGERFIQLLLHFRAKVCQIRLRVCVSVSVCALFIMCHRDHKMWWTAGRHLKPKQTDAKTSLKTHLERRIIITTVKALLAAIRG